MTYRDLNTSLTILSRCLNNCPYPDHEIIPDDDIIYSLQEIVNNIMFENDTKNYDSSKKSDA